MSSFCDLYSSGMGQTWPVRGFPSTNFPRGSAARSRDAARAWAFFEQVEAYDARVRVKYSSQGGFVPSTASVVTQAPWYIFKGEAERILYKRGQALHIQLCPDQNWTSQRMLGIPTTEVMNVYPNDCPGAPGGGARGIDIAGSSIMEDSPVISVASGFLEEVTTLNNNTPERRDSVSYP